MLFLTIFSLFTYLSCASYFLLQKADEGYGNRITVSIQQRNGRKSTTLIEGLDPEFNFTKILK